MLAALPTTEIFKHTFQLKKINSQLCEQSAFILKCFYYNEVVRMWANSVSKRRKSMKFGEYLEGKRKERAIPLRTFAQKIRISPSFLCDLESGYRTFPSDEKCEGLMGRIIKELTLNDEEAETLRKLADESMFSKGKVPSEIIHYLQSVPAAQMALRKAKESNASDETWQAIVEDMKKGN